MEAFREIVNGQPTMVTRYLVWEGDGLLLEVNPVSGAVATRHVWGAGGYQGYYLETRPAGHGPPPHHRLSCPARRAGLAASLVLQSAWPRLGPPADHANDHYRDHTCTMTSAGSPGAPSTILASFPRLSMEPHRRAECTAETHRVGFGRVALATEGLAWARKD